MNAITRMTTRTATIGNDDGITCVKIHAGMVQTLADAQENLKGAVAARGDVVRPLLVDISECAMLEPDARHYYASNALDGTFSSFALIIRSNPLGMMMGNVYMKLSRHKVPCKLFIDRSQAVAWLKKHI